MPEIKHQFTSGKMNKDVDERLVPNGEYRDAMNIQVSTSEESDVGAVENILSNIEISSYTIPKLKEYCVASIADEKNDVGYYLLASTNKFIQWNGISAITSPPVSVSVSGGATGGGGPGSSYTPDGTIILMHNSYTNPNPITIPTGDAPNVGDIITIDYLGVQTINTPTVTTITSVGPNISGINGPNTIDSYQITLSQAPIVGSLWLWNGSNIGHFTVEATFTHPEIQAETDLCLDLSNGYQLQRDMVVKFDGLSTTPVFVDPYTKTCFATLNSDETTVARFDTICQGNPHFIERNDIITSIETGFEGNSIRFDNLNIRIVDFKEEFFLLIPADIPNDIKPYLTNQPIRFTIGGENHRVLNFSKDKLITGINIIDDMLFWTDNHSEPKKINIDRSIQGTHHSSLLSTKLITHNENAHYHSNSLYGNSNTDAVSCKEEHITVIKKSPTTNLWVETQDATELTTGFLGHYNPPDYLYQNLTHFKELLIYNTNIIPAEWKSIEDSPEIVITKGGDDVEASVIEFDLTRNNDFYLVAGDIIVFNSTSTVLPSKDSFQLKVVLDYKNPITGNWIATVQYINPGFNIQDTYMWSEIFDETKERDTFKNKFPRFSYRYKYEDGEYSCFAPFTNPIFTPGVFSYEPKDAYNLGMQNTIRKISVKGYKNNMPLDVVQVDILYKESNSPLVYLVNSIKKFGGTPELIALGYGGDIGWSSFGSYIFNLPASTPYTINGYSISPNMTKATLPSNQLLRPWDNVPRLALAQEVTGNRIVYANYLQNYNVSNLPQLKVELKNALTTSNTFSLPRFQKNRSLKSIRSYSLGISYLDKFNRQSPVFSSEASEITIPIANSKDLNQIEVTPLSAAPSWATHYKIFIKDTSSEYYNLAMDRIYEAQDDNVWLSFPSSDRNKILKGGGQDEESFLILKKDAISEQPVTTKNKYKILAVENEAPEFIKTRKSLVAQSASTPGDIFTEPNYLPKKGEKRIKIKYNAWNAHQIPITDFEPPLAVAFNTTASNGVVTTTPHYNVMSLKVTDDSNAEPEFYEILLEKSIKELWLEKSPAPPPGSLPEDTLNETLKIRIYRKIIENKPEFDGRFFVKISRDPLIEKYALTQITSLNKNQYVGESAFEFNFLSDSDSLLAGNTGNKRSNDFSEWNTNLKFGEDEQTSGWFIDSTFYKGGYNESTAPWDPYCPNCTGTTYLRKEGMLRLNDVGPNFHPDDPEWEKSHGMWNYPNWPDYKQYDRSTVGHNKGIYTDTDGKHYIDLAFSSVGEDLMSMLNSEDLFLQQYLEYADTYSYQAAGYFIDGGWAVTTCGRWEGTINYNHFHPNYSPNLYPNGQGHKGTMPVCNESYDDGCDYRPPPSPAEVHHPYNGCNPNYSYMTDPSPITSESFNFYGDLADIDGYGTSNDDTNFWAVGSSLNPGINSIAEDQQEIVEKLVPDQKFRFAQGNNDNIIYTIKNVEVKHFVNHTNTAEVQYRWDLWGHYVAKKGCNDPGSHWDPPGFWQSILFDSSWYGRLPSSECGPIQMTSVRQLMKFMARADNRRTVYKIEIDINPLDSGVQTNDDGATVKNAWNPIDASQGGADATTKGEIQFVSLQPIYQVEEGELQSLSPAIWETESKADNDLDIYYEVDDALPLQINSNTNYDYAPIGTTFTPNSDIEAGGYKYTILEWANNRCRLDKALAPTYINSWYHDNKKWIDFLRPNGSRVKGRFLGIASPIEAIVGAAGSSEWIIIEKNVSKNPVRLSWFNCYSFGNGVESDRIRDDFNEVRIDKGAKASSTLDELYKEERRKYGLIYSGIYNSNSGVNNLNQFIAAEKITKDVNPIYGSVQKLHSRSTADGDLITLCEDRILRILANKDAVFNADGNTQLIATENVLGQTIPFTGEYGISTNPESFASESYRVYFTDKIRGAVMRLSKDGLTPISMYGMKNWFKDNLKLSNRIIGSYDDKKDEYNITLRQNDTAPTNVVIESKPKYTSGIHAETWTSIIDDSDDNMGL